MKISVDGGALNQKNNRHFGTSVFSENLVAALKKYDKNNKYFIYTFDNLKPKLFWLKGRVSVEEFTRKKDVFLALNQAIPLFTSGKIISFCHGLSYYFCPQYYSKKDVIRLNEQLKEMIKKSNIIIVSSQKVKNELVLMYQYIKTKVVVLPFGIPFDMKRNKEKKRMKFFLYIGMDHPIKNIDFIKEAFKKFKGSKEFKDHKLILVTKNCPRKKLCRLYKNAAALLTASHYESFNFPVLEALSQGCPVIGLKSAIIPELKPYVNLAGNIESFVEKMKKITKKPDARSISRLYGRFNWENYVKNLVKLYK